MEGWHIPVRSREEEREAGKERGAADSSRLEERGLEGGAERSREEQGGGRRSKIGRAHV